LASTFWGETTPTCLRQIVSVIFCPLFGEVWLISVDVRLRSLAVKQKAQFT